jgi:hypothetical protein
MSLVLCRSLVHVSYRARSEASTHSTRGVKLLASMSSEHEHVARRKPTHIPHINISCTIEPKHEARDSDCSARLSTRGSTLDVHVCMPDW